MCCRSTVLAACLVLAGAVPASAQETQHPLRLPTLVFAGAATADWITTYDGLSMWQQDAAFSRGGESDPLLKPLHNQPGPTVLAGAAMDILGVWAVNRFVGRKHPKLVATGLYIAAGLRVALAAHNAMLLSGHTTSPAVLNVPPMPHF